ncbi:MAG TPA: STAS domain-containing protein [Gaiellaceae bacterium]|nr:STAS domain-containing protein [Gaiellaceae bacterium]
MRGNGKRNRDVSWRNATTYDLEERESHMPGIAVVALAGELNLTNAHELAERLDDVVPPHGLVVDLNRLAFVDSAGLDRLFLLARERGHGRIAFVVEKTAPIATTLDTVGLVRAAILVPSVEEAFGALAAASPAR